jgi:hypothetical protein
MLKDFLKFLFFSAVLGGFVLLLMWFLLPKAGYAFRPELTEYALFSFVLTQMSYFVVLYIHNQNNNRTGFAFLALVLVKMAIAALYIIPQLKAAEADKFFLMFSFFGLYFFYLFLEARELMVLLNKDKFVPQKKED